MAAYYFELPCIGNLTPLNLRYLQRFHVAITKTNAGDVNASRQICHRQVFRIQGTSRNFDAMKHAAIGSRNVNRYIGVILNSIHNAQCFHDRVWCNQDAFRWSEGYFKRADFRECLLTHAAQTANAVEVSAIHRRFVQIRVLVSIHSVLFTHDGYDVAPGLHVGRVLHCVRVLSCFRKRGPTNQNGGAIGLIGSKVHIESIASRGTCRQHRNGDNIGFEELQPSRLAQRMNLEVSNNGPG